MTRLRIAMLTTKQIIIVIILSVIILLCIGGATYFAIKINSDYIKGKREALASGNIDLVMYEYEVDDFNFKYGAEPVEIYRAKFTDDLDEIFEFKNEHGYNIVEIKDGEVRVIEADCFNKTCMHGYLTNGIDLSESHFIICSPHGLKIVWEVSNEN